MDDATINLLLKDGGIIGALIVLLFIVKQLVPLRKNNNGTNAALDKKIEDAVEKGVTRALAARSELIRSLVTDPLLKELKETRHDLRNAMQTAIASAYQMGKSERSGGTQT